MEKFKCKNMIDKCINEYFDKNPVYSQLSGRYNYNGGVRALNNPSTLGYLEDYPIAPVTEPIYDSESWGPANDGEWDRTNALSFTLHIDIDGTDPLRVVSGTVAKSVSPLSSNPQHFIGQVTSNDLSGATRQLVVENFNFQWPGCNHQIDKLEIDLTGDNAAKPTAEAVFIDTCRKQRYGPYAMTQDSIFFRDIEIEIDREDNAVAVESYNTHTHLDRPSDLPQEELTIEKVFRKSGLRITLSSESNVIDTSAAGEDMRWSKQELHDAMQCHWSAFEQKPQWKMWLFLAELADNSNLGGIMFDGNIDEPGGVDRQGVAVFTKCPFFHSTDGYYITDNPPEEEAVQRELFYNMIHETGHAFNLHHSFEKSVETPWAAPDWMPRGDDPCALSWMNYPDVASQDCGGAAGKNASWFYNRFRYRFDDNENLFLRHAPERYVRMGDAQWEGNHGRVAKHSVDPRLEFKLRSRKSIFELGLPVLMEIRLRNISDKAVMVQGDLDPYDGFIHFMITNPRGERRPFIPFMRTRSTIQRCIIEPKQSLYKSVDLNMGKFGFPFKEPGPYRIEASYNNIYGGTAAAVSQIWVRPPANYDDMPIVSELFNARVGRVVSVSGSRSMEEENEKIDWVRKRLSTNNPAKYYLTASIGIPKVHAYKKLTAESKSIHIDGPDPEEAEHILNPIIDENEMNAAADAIGHITYRDIVDSYTKSALETGKKYRARKAQENLAGMFKKRKVVGDVIKSIEQRIYELN